MPKNGKRKSKSGEDDDAKALQEMIESLHERQKFEEERQEKWNEAWEQKFAEDEQLEKLKACCAPDEYFPAPHVQSNIWLQVSHEKNSQHVQMSFMNIPVPKPTIPPLPKLPLSEMPKKQDEEEKPKADGKKKTKKK